MPKPYIPSARPVTLRHECRSKPKPGSKTRSDKRRNENIVPRWTQPPYRPPTESELDAIDWDWIFGMGK